MHLLMRIRHTDPVENDYGLVVNYSVSSEFHQLQLQLHYVIETKLLDFTWFLWYTRLKLHSKLFFIVAVFITPACRQPGAAAGPASLALQAGLAQESVVVWGSPRSLPSDPSHSTCFHSEAHQQQGISEALNSPLESGISAEKIPAKFSWSATL